MYIWIQPKSHNGLKCRSSFCEKYFLISWDVTHIIIIIIINIIVIFIAIFIIVIIIIIIINIMQHQPCVGSVNQVIKARTQVLSAPISSLSLAFVQIQEARW